MKKASAFDELRELAKFFHIGAVAEGVSDDSIKSISKGEPMKSKYQDNYMMFKQLRDCATLMMFASLYDTEHDVERNFSTWDRLNKKLAALRKKPNMTITKKRGQDAKIKS